MQINEEKRARVQWNKLFEPHLYSKTELKELKEQEAPKDFDGGDYWEDDDEKG